MRKLNQITVMCVTALGALIVYSQDQARPEGPPGGPPGGGPEGARMQGRRWEAGAMAGGGMDGAMRLLRIIDDPETAQVIKLTDEQKDVLKRGSQALDERQTGVSEALRIAALEQVALAAKVMADKQATTNELMELVAKIGGLRTEQARIQTEKLLLIRDTLSAEQIQGANAAVQAQAEQMRERIRQRIAGAAGRFGAGGAEAGGAGAGNAGAGRATGAGRFGAGRAGAGARGGRGARADREQADAPKPQQPRPEGWEE